MSSPFDYFMAQHAEANPKLKMLYEMMQQNMRNSDPPAPANSKIQGQLQKLLQINKCLNNRNKQLKRQQRHLLKYLNFLVDVNTSVSSAVGACECWGEDNTCKNCHGKGRPGYFEVNPGAFRDYVMPCLEQVADEPPAPAKKPVMQYQTQS